MTASGPIQENIAALLAVAATIPIGFVIYQIYYFTYEPVLRLWPLPWRGRFVRRDRGGQILQTLDPDQIATLQKILECDIDPDEPHTVVPNAGSPIQKLMHLGGILEIAEPRKSLPMAGKARQLAYEDMWYTHWDTLRSAVDIAASYPGSKQVKSEYTTLSDIYHSLGAARTAVLSAWAIVSVLSVLHIGRVAAHPGETVMGIVAIFGLTAAIYAVCHVARGRTWRSAAASLTFGLRWLHWRHGHEVREPVADESEEAT